MLYSRPHSRKAEAAGKKKAKTRSRREVNARLFAKLAALTDADLSQSAKGMFPNSVQTVGDQITFLVMHDTYHVGQLAYVRKALGLPGVVG